MNANVRRAFTWRSAPRSPVSSYLDDRLGHFTNIEEKHDFLCRLWRVPDTHDGLQPFFKHFEDCNKLAHLSPHSFYLASQKNSDVFRVVEAVLSSRNYEEILQQVALAPVPPIPIGRVVGNNHTSTFSPATDPANNNNNINNNNIAHTNVEDVKCLVSLVLRTWLMCYIGSVGNELRFEQPQIEWTRGSLQEFLPQAFPKNGKLEDKVQLERSFQVSNIERIASIQILWTDNFLDHLKLQDPDREGNAFRVSIFKHARFLECHEHSDIFPPDLVAETLRTLALLLPGYEKPVKQWFKKQCARNDSLDPSLIQRKYVDSEQRRIESFTYWRDRLTMLKQAYDESEPRNIYQWWNDGRNSVQWATFWVAAVVLALTIFFGMVQSVEGAIQVYKAYHPSK